jgi:hypothetical protein
LVADSGLVIRPIQVTNLDHVLDIYPNLAAALPGRGAQQEP